MSTQPVVVTFDVGGTLLAPWPSVGHVYAAVAARWDGKAPDPEVVNRRFRAAWAARGAAFDYSREAWAALVRETLRGLSPCADNPAFFAALYEHFAAPEPWRVFPDAVPALEALRRGGYRLAVVSNWDLRLRPLLRALKLAEFFEVLVISGEVGWHKPDPRLFARATRQLGVRPEQILHVGDSWVEDVLGARAAGWQAAWVVRDGEPPPVSEARVVRSLTEVPRFLPRVERCGSAPGTEPLSPAGPQTNTWGEHVDAGRLGH